MNVFQAPEFLDCGYVPLLSHVRGRPQVVAAMAGVIVCLRWCHVHLGECRTGEPFNLAGTVAGQLVEWLRTERGILCCLSDAESGLLQSGDDMGG